MEEDSGEFCNLVGRSQMGSPYSHRVCDVAGWIRERGEVAKSMRNGRMFRGGIIDIAEIRGVAGAAQEIARRMRYRPVSQMGGERGIYGKR